MKLSRKAIQRMVDSGQVNIGGRRTGSGGGGGGGVSATWVEENYISKAFFNTLFTIHGHDADDTSVPPTDVVIEPNDTETVLDSIEAMVGLWTEQYLSALGLSSGGGGGGDILAEPLVSINGIGTPTAANRTLVWNGTQWTFQPYGQGGGSVTSIRITVPTGFNVSPSTAITTAGTFAITFASGYSLPTTAKQTNWDTAYTNNHTHANKTVLDGISSTKVSNWDTAYSKANTLESYFDGSGNAKSALKLTTVSKTAWGKTYWTSGGVPDSISGDMSSVGNISFSASGKNIGGVAYFDTTNSRLGIGAAPGAYKLDVNGAVHLSDNLYLNSTKKIVCMVNSTSKTLLDFDGTQVTLGYGFNGSNATHIYGQNINMYHGTSLKVQVTTDGLKIGGATLSWDSDAGALKIDTGFYSETFISALGANSSSGGGVGDVTWSALASSADDRQIAASHLDVLSNYVTRGTTQDISGTKTFTTDLKMAANITPYIANQYSLGTNSYRFANMYVQNGDMSGNLYVGGRVSIGGTNSSYKLYVVGGARVSSINIDGMIIEHNAANYEYHIYTSEEEVYTDADWYGSWRSSSDIRKKNIVDYLDVSIEQIAKMPVFNFTWKKGKQGTYLGTSAQEVQKIFPNAVSQMKDGYLAMDYGAAALAAAVMTARKVVNHEERIRQLERENEELRKQLNLA